MTAKEYLSQAYLLDQRISSNIEEAARLREMAVSLRSPSLEPNYDASPSTEALFVRPLERVLELEEHINAEVDALVELKAQIHQAIDTVEDHNERMVLHYRYIDGLSWDDIARAVKVSSRTAYRIHGSALKKFKIPH